MIQNPEVAKGTEATMEDEVETTGEIEKGAQADIHDSRETRVRDTMKVLTGLSAETPMKRNGEKEMTKLENNREVILQSFFAQLTVTTGKY